MLGDPEIAAESSPNLSTVAAEDVCVDWSGIEALTRKPVCVPSCRHSRNTEGSGVLDKQTKGASVNNVIASSS